VFTADCAPRDLPLELADLRTRLGWGLVYQLRALDDDDKCALIRQRGRDRGLDIAAEVAEFLLRRVPRDVGRLCEIIDTIDSASLAAQRHVTIPFVRSLLDAG
jgi:DnaA family protein